MLSANTFPNVECRGREGRDVWNSPHLSRFYSIPPLSCDFKQIDWFQVSRHRLCVSFQGQKAIVFFIEN